MDNPLIVITCTRPRCDEIVDDLTRRNLNAIACPLLTVEKTPCAPPQGEYQAMLLTSRHALTENMPDLPVIAVGDQTAHEAVKAGLTVIHTGPGDINGLDLSDYQSLLYPCAHEPSHIPACCTPWRVYKTVPGETASTAPASTAIIVFFSARGMRHFSHPDSHKMTALCLSEQIARAADNIPFRNLAVCDHPDYDTMRELIFTHAVLRARN